MKEEELVQRLEEIKDTLYPIDKEAKSKIDSLIYDIRYDYKKYRS